VDTQVDIENRVISDSDYFYQYDNNGNLIRKINKKTREFLSFSYDEENRLVVVKSLNKLVQYKYDPFGRRIEKNVNGKVTQYVYDGDNVIEEYTENVNAVDRKHYIHTLSIDEPLALEQNGKMYYYHQDGLGSVWGMTSTTGKLMQRYQYKSFGEMVGFGRTSLSQSYTFTGRENDSETGLYYYRARYYDPKMGRFISKDPIGFDGGDVNLYAYTGNNPVNRKDPSGLAWYRYGNWCGSGGSGTPTNCYDSACKRHDECYDKCGIDALSRWFPGNILGGCAKTCDEALLKEWKNCACSHGAKRN